MSHAAVLHQNARLPFWRQLRWNLAIYFLILAIVPVIAAQSITLWLLTQNARSAVVNQLQSLATIKANELQQWEQQANSSMGIILADSNIYDGITRLLSAGNSSADAQQIVSQYLQGVVAQKQSPDTLFTVFKDLFIYNLQGRIVAASTDLLTGRVVNRQPYFNESLKAAYLQPPYYAVDTGALTMVYSQPVLDADNKIIGVLAGSLDINTLGQIMIERGGLGNTDETYLVSAENNYLLSPSRFDGYPLNHAYYSQGIESALKGQDGVGVYQSYRNGTVIGVYRWLPELHAALLAEIDQSEALSSAAQVLASSLLVTIVAALFALAIGFLRISQISAPIAMLTQVATRIAGGDLTQRAAIKQRNEIGLLANSFNGMTEQLVTNIARLDQNVHEIENLIKDLQAAKRLAEENSRLKSEFLSTMSHELRTPLNAIEGFTGIILNKIGGTDYNAKTEGFLTRIRSNSKRLLQLINDFLDLSRVEAGRLELANQPFSPERLAKRWQDEIGVLAEKKGLQLQVSMDSSLPDTLYGDEEAISKVALNLLGNAIKFTEQGQVALAMERIDGTWGITVADTGIGIPPHAREFIFEEFRQVDQSSRRKYGGTGLGLAIVQKYTRAMGGTVQVKSEFGKGSTFTVSLPLKTTA